MLIKCQYTSWLVYIRRPFRLYMIPLMAGNKTEEDIEDHIAAFGVSDDTRHSNEESAITVEHQLLPELGTHHPPAAFPLHHLVVFFVVPALGLVKGHEQQREFSPVRQLFGQGAVATHQQRPNQARVDVPFL